MSTDKSLIKFLLSLDKYKYDLFMSLLLSKRDEFLILNKNLSLFPEIETIYNNNIFIIKETFIRNLGSNIFKYMNKKDAVKILSKLT